MRSRVISALVLAAASASPAFAQGTYVSASLTADVVRFSHSESEGAPEFPRDGEAIGFSLRVGTPVGSSWGVEAEFARPAEIESDGVPGPYPMPAWLSYTTDGVTTVTPEPVTRSGMYEIFPAFSYRVRTSERTTTWSAALWARQTLTARMALVYSGGLGFHRSDRETAFTFTPVSPLPGRPGIPIVMPTPSITRVITYSARPFAGIDARIAMTDHVELVPGLRVHGLDGGVLLRPSVGLAWMF